MDILNSPILAVKYKNFWYYFYSKVDYDNWIKTCDKEYISDCKYYKGRNHKY